MGILSRISKVLESNVNALVDRAEDPAKMLDQAIEDMKKGHREARAAIVEAKTQRRLLERKLDKTQSEAESLEQRAVRALRDSDEANARRFLELKLAADQRAAAELTALEEQDSQIEQLMAAERELEIRLSQLPARRAALLARQSAAQAKGVRVGAASKAKNSVSTALDAFERMEERIIRAEVEAEVISESGPSHLLDVPAADPGGDASAALEALKGRLAGELPAKTGEGSTPKQLPEKSAVDDSLAALKAKLDE